MASSADRGSRPREGASRARRCGGASVSVAPRFTTNLPDVVIASARAGHGLGMLLSYMVANELEHGGLVAVLTAWEPPPLPVHVVHGAGRRAAARVRPFVDHAVAGLRRFQSPMHGAGDDPT